MPALQKKHKKSSVHNIKSVMNTRYGPSVEIRTRGLLNPIQARYQTSPHPDILFFASSESNHLIYNTTERGKCQHIFSEKTIFSSFVFIDKAFSLW